ncbi:hypothetical protein BDZ97DRAFT_1914260 [Flammula alnicola]|nr:hypothetical protein BDZ97DRAFT_1914260 [Flammula alnicola]
MKSLPWLLASVDGTQVCRCAGVGDAGGLSLSLYPRCRGVVIIVPAAASSSSMHPQRHGVMVVAPAAAASLSMHLPLQRRWCTRHHGFIIAAAAAGSSCWCSRVVILLEVQPQCCARKSQPRVLAALAMLVHPAAL